MKKLLSLLLLLLLFVTKGNGQAALQDDLALKYVARLPLEISRHAPVIILLHGLGSDEKDLFGLADLFPKKYLIISVRAPYSVPAGGYQWYEGTVANGHRNGNKAQLGSSRALTAKFILQVVKKYKADAKNVNLIGFSQGAVMSYETGLTNPASVKGIAVLSGMIFNSLKPYITNTPALNQLHIFIAHGINDQRIPYAEGKAAADYLKSIGLKPELHTYDGMGHQINKEVLKDLLNWLK